MYLNELAKEYRKINGKHTPAEITSVGGAAILAKYGFRDKTYDVDAMVYAASSMKEAANRSETNMIYPTTGSTQTSKTQRHTLPD